MGKTVLIVDDHPSFRTSARRMLETDGYEVVGEAADGGSAIDAVRELHPDVVLLDIRLPDVDGFQVAERLAANGAAPAIVNAIENATGVSIHHIPVMPESLMEALAVTEKAVERA